MVVRLLISKFKIEDEQLILFIQKNYGILIKDIEFIPVGDSAYSYKVNCIDEQQYYLKLFDHHNDRQREGIRRLNYYLPLTWDLYHQGLFINITHPIKNCFGSLFTKLQDITIVLFNFIVGETLTEAYPFSDEILVGIAKSVATLEQITPHVNQNLLPKESFDITFESDLLRCISILEKSNLNNCLKQSLRELVLLKKEQILFFMNLVREIRNSVHINASQLVLCHGDMWGGNIIYHNNQLFFLDWESVIIAPPEYNLFGYIGSSFDIFISSYIKQLDRKIQINLDLIRFYSYRAHLRNLSNWVMNILFRNKDESQSINDLEMIRNHCLNRFDQIDPNIRNIRRDIVS